MIEAFEEIFPLDPLGPPNGRLIFLELVYTDITLSCLSAPGPKGRLIFLELVYLDIAESSPMKGNVGRGLIA